MKVLKKHGINFLIWIILIGMGIVRLTAYGNLNLSVSNADTPSYVHEAAGPIFAKDMFTRNRLFTTNLLYHLADVQECKIGAVSHPALGLEIDRIIQPCFNRIVLFQNLLAVIAWSLLALVVSKRLTGAFEKLLATFLILAFGFTPAIADWDSVLGSESLTFSLFAISLALLLEFCFNVAKNSEDRKRSIFINSLTLAALILWAFTRDANIYAIAVLLAFSIITIIIFPNLRKNKNLLILMTAAFLTTVIGLQSAAASNRWKMPLDNVFTEYILPYPARVEFMENLGMPDPASDTYLKWFNENAPRAYARFLLFHPGFTSTSFSSNLGGIFSENIQPYFYSEQTSIRKTLIAANDLLHPNTQLVFFLDILLITGLIFSVFRRSNQNLTVWVWLGTWLFISASAMLVINYFADSIGITRHTLFSVELFRLMLWVFLIVLFDHANRKDEEILVSHV